jgi:hypothetical protein
MNSVMAINSESIPIPIPTPTPSVARIRPAVRGRPKPRLPGVVDYSITKDIRSTTLKFLVFLAQFWCPAEQQSRARKQADI